MIAQTIIPIPDTANIPEYFSKFREAEVSKEVKTT